MTILHTFDDIWNFLKSGNWKSANLENPRNWLVWTNFDILGIFPTQFRSLSMIVKSELQNSYFSGNLEIPRNWLVWTNFDILGIFPTQFRSLIMIAKSELQNSYFFGILPEIFWKSGNSQKLAGFYQF